MTANNEGKKWSEIPIGGVVDRPGSSEDYKTGEWRDSRPIHIPEKCINCMICWSVCPDCAVVGKDGDFKEFNYDYCKGCGVCAEECPDDAIKMEEEGDFPNSVEEKK